LDNKRKRRENWKKQVLAIIEICCEN